MTSTFQAREVHQEFSQDQLRVMLQQEEKFYRCRDFLQLQVQGMGPIHHSPLHVVQECALIVTDVPELESRSTDATNHQRSTSSLVRSPVLVSTFPPPSHNDEGSDGSHTGWSKFPFAFLPSTEDTMETPLCPNEAACLITWRTQMLDWAYNLTSTYNLDQEVVAVAFRLFDRYVASEVLSDDVNYAEAPLDREDIQLYAMVCMYIAIKSLVPYRKLTIDCIIEMSRGFYTPEHIIESELEILSALEWHVNQPTNMDYCRLYLNLFPNTRNEDTIIASCQHLAELALYDVYFIAMPTSCVALATVLLASQRFGVSSPETEGFLENLRGLVNVKTDELDALLRRLESLC